MRLLIAAFLSALALQGGALPPPFPREGATKLIDNDRVTVWDVTWKKGVKTPLHEHRAPAVGVVIDAGTVMMTMANGEVRPASLSERGRAIFSAPGLTHLEEGQSDSPARAIVVELKDAPRQAGEKPAGVPEAFPRPGATNLIDNERVRVWNVTWPTGKADTHFHGMDVVAIGVEGGTTRSVPQTGSAATTVWKVGAVRFNPRGRLHSEEVVDGRPRLVAIELK